MKPKASALIVGAGVAIAAAAGITYAVVQPRTEVSPPPVVESPVSPAPTTSPKTDAAAPPPSSPTPTTPQSPPTLLAKREREFCRIAMAKVNDPEPPLNVRSAPSTSAPIRGTLPNGTWVNVSQEEQGWLLITAPQSGWIAKNRTLHDCNMKQERLTFSGDRGYVVISDQFIGTGNHRYIVPLTQGQQLTLDTEKGPLPRLIGPDGTLLTPMGGESESQWTGTLPQNGDYTLELDSNYKGYDYTFRVTLN